ncbi:MAG: hypothetical protein A4S09_07690 [Proteobacteria bacterium SG_bin7]|nr:MAG: hypothetical protein A4S09_07690 [Proteobacteria bacterium SG_bin7]
MKFLSAVMILVSVTAFTADTPIQETGVGSGLNAISACSVSDNDAEARAITRCNGTITSKSCSQFPSQFGNTYSCISMCQFTCKQN